MSEMKVLYEKVARDSVLQAKFSQILQDAEKAGEDETRNRLLSFAKEAGYEVGMNEMQEFFRTLTEKREGELSELELDMVAGGKAEEAKDRFQNARNSANSEFSLENCI